ncbi:MAG: hypothetical protein PUK49_08395, partial [Oscillospiraceae bacterium]|nr:hypothetical protein [Oscillospiraceae bacterium]
GKVQGFLAETPKILAPNNRKNAPKQSFYALFPLLSRHYIRLCSKFFAYFIITLIFAVFNSKPLIFL